MRDDIPLDRSVWDANAPPPPEAKPLVGTIRTKIAIVGAGYTGCCAAIRLADKGIDTVLIEAREPGWGGSGRNAGLVNAGLWVDPSAIIAHYGDVCGLRLVHGLSEAPKLVRDLIDRFGIDCDAGSRGIIKAARSTRHLAAVAETVRQWRELGANVELLDSASTAAMTGTSAYPGALVDHRSFTIEPLAYARGLAGAAIAMGVRLHAPSEARRIEATGSGVRIVTGNGEIRADRAIIATGAYDSSLIPGMTHGFVPVGYFMLATAPVSDNLRNSILPGKVAVYDTSPSLLALRYDRHHRLLIGNLGWLPSPGLGERWARRALSRVFPAASELAFTHRWGGTIDFTDDHMPWLAEPMPRVHMVGGYNGRGIAPGAYWGRVLADWATGMPRPELPVPVVEPPAIAGRWLKQQFFANSWRAWRLWEQIEGRLRRY